MCFLQNTLGILHVEVLQEMFRCDACSFPECPLEMVRTHAHRFGNGFQRWLLPAVVSYEPYRLGYAGIIHFFLFFSHVFAI